MGYEQKKINFVSCEADSHHRCRHRFVDNNKFTSLSQNLQRFSLFINVCQLEMPIMR